MIQRARAVGHPASHAFERLPHARAARCTSCMRGLRSADQRQVDMVARVAAAYWSTASEPSRLLWQMRRSTTGHRSKDGDNVRLSVGDPAIPQLPPLDCSG
jgi:hypothetical protein